MNGYRYNTIAEVNDAIQKVNTANNFTPTQGNVTQTLIDSSMCTYNEETFYFISYDPICLSSLGQPTEIQIQVNPLEI